MNYKIGDTVIIKNVVINEKNTAKKYIYLGLSNEKIKPIVYAKIVMGDNSKIGMFIHKHIEPVFVDYNHYVVELLFFDVNMFEKDE